MLAREGNRVSEGTFLFPHHSRKVRHSVCKTPVQGGQQEVFHLDGQRDAFLKFIVAEQGETWLGSGQAARAAKTGPACRARKLGKKGAYRDSFVSFGNEDREEDGFQKQAPYIL